MAEAEEHVVHPKSVEKPKARTRLFATEIRDNVFGPAEEALARQAASLFYSALARMPGALVVPAALGVAEGGAVLVALPNYGQVAPERSGSVLAFGTTLEWRAAAASLC